ncbi:MAG: formylglycine-generating enzyme family protein [Myxococcota bacterium]
MRRLILNAMFACGASAVALSGCAEGIVPPEPTEMVEIKSGLTYMFGQSGPCVLEGKVDPCTSSRVPALFPQAQVTLAAFALDKHEVTNLQYEYCVAAGACSDPPFDNAVATEQQDYYGRARFEQFPVVNVTWQQAKDYCAFVGKRLPTEFEWERAAKGNPDEGKNRVYPAEGVNVLSDCRSSDFTSSACRNDQLMDRTDQPGKDIVMEGGQGINHMFGNASEWVDTQYAPSVTTCASDLPPPCIQRADCDSKPADEQLQCKQDSKTCAACVQDPGGAGTLPCFYICEGTALSTPFCVEYPAGISVSLESLTAQLADGPLGPMIRGGNVQINAENGCQFRSDYRLNYANTDDTKFNVGFRCAKSL